ncbi:S26 family signal peptidase [Consotaella salsifontis]|uniref:Conjugative transfer signal peptidase TraF n=1 Tax=Consotaella salsifontis TaxID=1365950 RepID=A0A1T4TB68_9HYPH|nr:S26 family signal peptidase [Consotaella salsifontis]SKA37459.1 conjugative transfer signal peptidase TraF [Consotaella salsifontis]
MTRAAILAASCVAVALVGGSLATPSAPKLLWNASASAPIGLYLTMPVDTLKTGDLVAATPPERLARFMADRGYLPCGVPLIKHVLGLPGQNVCRNGRSVRLDDKTVGEALDRDRMGRPLPVWQGCRRIVKDEVFLMNTSVRDSFDGRYFGPLPARTVIGRAIPIATDADGDGRFEWRGPAW